MHRRPLTFQLDGIVYDLSHTFPFTKKVVTAGVPEGVDTKVVMSCHCFTEAANKYPEIAPNYTFEDESRLFSIERHALSVHLPDLIEQVIEKAIASSVYSTTDKNGATNYAIVELKKGEEAQYIVYFDVHKRRGGGGDIYILMNIKSAYLNEIRLSSRNKTRFGTLLDKLLGRHVSAKRRKKKQKRVKK